MQMNTFLQNCSHFLYFLFSFLYFFQYSLLLYFNFLILTTAHVKVVLAQFTFFVCRLFHFHLPIMRGFVYLDSSQMDGFSFKMF